MKEKIYLPEIVNNSTLSLQEITTALEIPRNIVASDEEIAEVWRNLPNIMKKIPKDKISSGLAKMCIAVSSGLFDSAINYIWNASVIELRNKIKNFGLNIIGQILSKKDFDENKLNDLKDAELLDLCLQLNLITEDGYFFLNQCREIRNNFSAAHPTIGDLDHYEFINFFSRCVKYALGNEYNPIGIDFKEFINALKLSKFTDEQLLTWVERLKKTYEAQRELLITTLHGMYCDSQSSEETRVNCLHIVDKLKNKLTPTIKSNLINQHQSYIAQGKKDKHKASQIFFEKLELLKLLEESEHHVLISNTCEKLWSIHQSIDNFYNEPPFAERLYQLSTQFPIPQTAQKEYVYTVIGCGIGNQYGTSNKALPFYEKMIRNFSPNEVQIMFDILNENNLVSQRIKYYPRCKNKYKYFVNLIDKSTVSAKHIKIYEEWKK
jgi:hypothetical protein